MQSEKGRGDAKRAGPGEVVQRDAAYNSVGNQLFVSKVLLVAGAGQLADGEKNVHDIGARTKAQLCGGVGEEAAGMVGAHGWL